MRVGAHGHAPLRSDKGPLSKDAMTRPERQQTVLNVLREFRGLEPLKQLFWSELNYQRVNEPIPRHGWAETASKGLAEDPVLFAGGGQDNAFHVIYARLASDRLLLGSERPVVSRLLHDHPYALFVFSNKTQDRWHFLNVKYDEETAKRRIFRRITVDPEDNRLRTASECIGQLDLTSISPELFAIPPLDIQEKHDRAFDKEPLTKDFFKRFEVALESVKSDLEEFQGLRSAEAYTQAQLLLERLIFLYFLQNRGWLNQDRRYLPDRLPDYLLKPKAFTFYSEFLDKLFWTLSSAPGEGGRLPGIPFLNRGLFDDDEFRQPGESRKTNPVLKVRNITFDTVFSGLLEAFNFTVMEDTPLNQEVAVDPEMLGKVFESIVLHAEAADPDATAPDKRKATGSYYTPRIVVHFICREVLYQYLNARLGSVTPGRGAWPCAPTAAGEWSKKLRTLLEIDASEGIDEETKHLLEATLTPEQAVHLRELMLPLKCCDPAVGSGAFPVGLLHELVNLRRLLTTVANGYVDPIRHQGSTWLQETKADIMQNCLFGVDIQQQAIEICRLRLWLSLVVDYDLGVDPFTAEKNQFSSAIGHISQLPNLEMNFHRGDSLHDHISGVPVVILPDRASHHADEFHAIAKLGAKLHKAKSADTKKKYRLGILDKRLAVSERILDEEMKALRTSDSALDTLFGLPESAAEKRKRNEQELKRLGEAVAKIGQDRNDLERLRNHAFDSQFYPKLRKLEGADFDSPFNFAWRLDFPNIFSANGSGFDIVVGNPPFVTARSPGKRELWSDRWPRVCYKNYLLLCPFFELGFGLLRARGELGFIVSNAFAKRDLGRPLVEELLATREIQKIIDCSGLIFPGHGTPTCLIFGENHTPGRDEPVRVVGILPGGGDLRTPPEESPLWQDIENHHTDSGFSNSRIVVSDRSRNEMSRWPWSFVPEGPNNSIEARARLADFTSEPVGAQFITGKDEVFVQPQDYFRRAQLPTTQMRRYGTGEDVRNWTALPTEWIVFPYTGALEPLKEPLPPALARHLRPFRQVLENSIISGSTKKKETNLKWFEFRRLARAKLKARLNIIIPQIATHAHFSVFDHRVAFKEKAQAIVLEPEIDEDGHHLLSGLLNTSLILEWLKQECFNKGPGEDEHRDRFEYAGGKVEQVPVARFVTERLGGKANALSDRLTVLSRRCRMGGQRLPGLALKRLFEEPGEAYCEWISSLPGYVLCDEALRPPFASERDLRCAYKRVQEVREGVRAEMVALQEEMDWLVYAAYGLLPEEHPAVALGKGAWPCAPTAAQGDSVLVLPLDQAQRPFRLWAQAEGDYKKAVALIPCDWSSERRKLWQARLAAIRDNEHIRRIEQPVYKRRWDEQWKVGNQWRCGPIAYAAEFIDAFEWWLREKAEWWLENKKNGGPVELGDWARALWKDWRVQAAWPVAAENYALLEYEKTRERADDVGAHGHAPLQAAADAASFVKALKRIIDDETVPEGIPWATPYDELEEKQKIKIPSKVKSIRGKLNVPRERFHLRGKREYLWAGLQFRE